MKTLDLTVKKTVSDMVNTGEQREIYADIKASLISRIFDFPDDAEQFGGGDGETPPNLASEALNEGKALQDVLSILNANIEHFDTVTLKTSNLKNAPKLFVELKSIEVGHGRPEWGAEPGKRYFIFNLGRISKQ